MSLSPSEDGIRLNKYIASSGICTRREASTKIKAGEVQVNKEIILFPGHLLSVSDKVLLNGKEINPIYNYSYILINKPKKTVSTTDDVSGEKTLSKILGNKVTAKVEPIDALGTNDTGLLLLTDDADLLAKYRTPNHQAKMILHLFLEEEMSEEHINQVAEQLSLEPYNVAVGFIQHIKGKDKNEVDLELNIGQIDLVKKYFEEKGIKVIKIDRIYYAGLTKKDLSRDRFRPLTQKEIILLKHFT